MDVFDPDLFWDQVRGFGDCWVWTGYRQPNGYGLVRGYTFTERYAHRLSWTMANGPIPAGMWVLHHCDNPPCINPDHLYLGTGIDNARDRERRGRGNHPSGEVWYSRLRAGRREPRTQCLRGHAVTPENTVAYSDGFQRCRSCRDERLARRDRSARVTSA
jgi:hypothetical protein